MKKLALAAAVLATTGSAAAQSSVTLFGVVDTDLSIGRGTIANRTQLSNSGNATSRLGFRGVEDLGGGLAASFWLEAALATDNGSSPATNTNNQANGASGGGGLTFSRRATVSLVSPWGELRLGRDYTPQYWNLYFADPFGNVGVGLPMPAVYTFGGFTGSTAVRAANTITYFLPDAVLGGFFGSIQYYLGENASNAGATKDDGRGGGIRLGYASGPFYAAIASGRTEYAAGDTRQSNAVVTWNFKVAKIGAQISRDKNGSLSGKGWLLGGWVPVGAGQILGSYSRYETTAPGHPEGKKLALGYVHNLSKRTALYGTWARLKNGGGAAIGLNGAITAANSSSSGLDLGIRHTF